MRQYARNGCKDPYCILHVESTACSNVNVHRVCNANMPTGSLGGLPTGILGLPIEDENEPGPEPDDKAPELMSWRCKKGHTWQTYGEVAFMTFIDPLSSEELTTGPMCVKCYFKSLADYFGAERKDNNYGYRP